jgi:hypothetical protein
MREVNVQPQSWSVLDDENLAADEAEEFDETGDIAYSFSYARV